MEKLDTQELEVAFKQQAERCRVAAEGVKDELIRKADSASRNAVKLLQRYADSKHKKQDSKMEVLRSAINSYSKSILDFTYYHEKQQTESNFTEVSSLDAIAYIIHTLSLPAQLCSSVPGGIVAILGLEVLECLYWRVGALLYMYCYAMYTNEDRRRRMDVNKFLKCCCAGVAHLRQMLTVRTPLGEEEDYLTNDSIMVDLLKQGIFSDIHMLSLMYSGDMCYWAWILTAAPSPLNTTPIQPVNSSTTPTEKPKLTVGVAWNTSALSSNSSSRQSDSSPSLTKQLNLLAKPTEQSKSSSISYSSAAVVLDQAAAGMESGKGVVEKCPDAAGPTPDFSSEHGNQSNMHTADTVKPSGAHGLPNIEGTVTVGEDIASCKKDAETSPEGLKNAESAAHTPIVNGKENMLKGLPVWKDESVQEPTVGRMESSGTASASCSPPSPSCPWPSPGSSSGTSPSVPPQQTHHHVEREQKTSDLDTAISIMRVEPVVDSATCSQDTLTGSTLVLERSPTGHKASSQKEPTSFSDSHVAEDVARSDKRTSLELYCVLQHTIGEEAVTHWVCDYDPHRHGLEVLSKYIRVARGPLKGAGWDYSRAVELVVKLKKRTV